MNKFSKFFFATLFFVCGTIMVYAGQDEQKNIVILQPHGKCGFQKTLCKSNAILF